MTPQRTCDNAAHLSGPLIFRFLFSPLWPRGHEGKPTESGVIVYQTLNFPEARFHEKRAARVSSVYC